MRVVLGAILLVACAPRGENDDIPVRPDTDPDPVYVGSVEVTPEALEIVDAPVGERTVGGVTVANIGDYDLKLIAATMADNGGKALETDERTNAGRVLRKGGSYEILVVCRPPTADPITGVLRIETDDQATPEIDVPVTCTPPVDDTDG